MDRRIVNDIEKLRGQNVALRVETRDWKARYSAAELKRRQLESKLAAIEAARRMKGGKP